MANYLFSWNLHCLDSRLVAERVATQVVKGLYLTSIRSRKETC